MAKLVSLYPPIKRLTIENLEARLENEQGERERMRQVKIEHTFQMHVLQTYCLNYFLLLCFTALVLFSKDFQAPTNCKIAYPQWYKVTASFYLLFMIVTCAIFLKLKGLRNEVHRVNFGWFELLYFHFPHRSPAFALLGVIDVIHFALTVWGSKLFFGETSSDITECMISMPSLVNFMLILLVFGYLMMVRIVITWTHFRYGKSVYSWIRRKGPCFRRFDRRDRQDA